jgi:phytanoyl-CoA hydroxylase
MDCYQNYRDNGYAIVPNVFTAEECERLIKDAEPLNTGQVVHPNPHMYLPEIIEFMSDKRLKDIVTPILGDDIVGLQTHYYFSPPGTKGYFLHQDNYCIETDLDALVSCWIPLVDITDFNGGLIAYPGSHKNGVLPVECVTERNDVFSNIGERVVFNANQPFEYLTCKRGSVILIHGATVHGSQPNLTHNNRYVFLATYKKRGVPFREGNTSKRSEIELW